MNLSSPIGSFFNYQAYVYGKEFKNFLHMSNSYIDFVRKGTYNVYELDMVSYDEDEYQFYFSVTSLTGSAKDIYGNQDNLPDQIQDYQYQTLCKFRVVIFRSRV